MGVMGGAGGLEQVRWDAECSDRVAVESHDVPSEVQQHQAEHLFVAQGRTSNTSALTATRAGRDDAALSIEVQLHA